MDANVEELCKAHTALHAEAKRSKEDLNEQKEARTALQEMSMESMQKNDLKCVQLSEKLYARLVFPQARPRPIKCEEDARKLLKGFQLGGVTSEERAEHAVRTVQTVMRQTAPPPPPSAQPRVSVVSTRPRGQTAVAISSAPPETRNLLGQLSETIRDYKQSSEPLKQLRATCREAEKKVATTLQEPSVHVRVASGEKTSLLRVVKTERPRPVTIGVRAFLAMVRQAAQALHDLPMAAFPHALEERVVSMVKDALEDKKKQAGTTSVKVLRR
jgi:hypothetical protein